MLNLQCWQKEKKKKNKNKKTQKTKKMKKLRNMKLMMPRSNIEKSKKEWLRME